MDEGPAEVSFHRAWKQVCAEQEFVGLTDSDRE